MTTRRSFALTLAGPAAALAADSAKVAQARRAAEQWLALVDEGDYTQSWRAAASFFRERVAESDWPAMLQQVRGPLGAVRSRELLRAQPADSLPGAPDGEYVVLQFRTSFEHKNQAVETITPMKDSDGQWRVSGYFLK